MVLYAKFKINGGYFTMKSKKKQDGVGRSLRDAKLVFTGKHISVQKIQDDTLTVHYITPEILSSRQGLWIPQWVNELGLSGLNKEIFAIILGFNTSCKVFSGSIAYLERQTGFSRRTIIRELRYLVDRGNIFKKEIAGKGALYIVDPSILVKIARRGIFSKLSKDYNLYYLAHKVLSNEQLEQYNIYPPDLRASLYDIPQVVKDDIEDAGNE